MEGKEIVKLFRELTECVRGHHNAANGIHDDLLERADAFLADAKKELHQQKTPTK